MKTKRIPRKEIAMLFKNGMDIEALAWDYQDYFPEMTRIQREQAIIEIIRQYMRKQKS